jgi:hypothetical protein
MTEQALPIFNYLLPPLLPLMASGPAPPTDLYLFSMAPPCSYVNHITIDMTDEAVMDIICQSFGSSSGDLTELDIWTHYKDALSCQDQLSWDNELSSMIKNTNLPFGPEVF